MKKRRKVNVECFWCGKSFVKEIVSGRSILNNYQCEECYQKTRPSKLKPTCYACGKRFKNVHALTIHQGKTGHRQTALEKELDMIPE